MTDPSFAGRLIVESIGRINARRLGTKEEKLRPLEIPVQTTWEVVAPHFDTELITPVVQAHFRGIPLVVESWESGYPIKRPVAFANPAALKYWLIDSATSLADAVGRAAVQAVAAPSSAKTWSGLMSGPLQTKVAFKVGALVVAEARSRFPGDVRTQGRFAREFMYSFGPPLQDSVEFTEKEALGTTYLQCCWKDGRLPKMCGLCPRRDRSAATESAMGLLLELPPPALAPLRSAV